MAEFLSAGHAFLQVTPSFQNIREAMGKEVKKMAREIDKGLRDTLGPAMKDSAIKSGEEAGKEGGKRYAGHFSDTVQKQLALVAKALPALEPKVKGEKLSKLEKQLKRLHKDAKELSEQKIGFDIDEETMREAIRGLDSGLQRLERTAEKTGDKINLKEAAKQIRVLTDMTDEFERVERRAGRFADQMKERLTKAFEALPNTIPLKVKDEEAHKRLLKIRSEMVKLSGKTIGVDISAAKAMLKLESLERKLFQLAHEDVDIEVRADARAALDEIAHLTGGVEKAEVRIGKFADNIKTRLRSVVQGLPNTIPVDIDDASAHRKLLDIRTELAALSDKTVGVDIDAGRMLTELRHLERRLRDLDNKSVDVQVRSDARSAIAEIGQLTGSLDGSSNAVRRMNSEFGYTTTRLGFIIALVTAFGSALVPIAAGVAASIGFIGAAAAAAVVGVGAFAIGISGIAEAVKALSKADEEAEKGSVAMQAAQNRVASAAESVANAEQGLANARSSAAESAQSAARQIADAERAVSDARKQAAEQVRTAIAAQADAERDLRRANLDALAVRRDLTRAQREAADQMAELNSQVKRNALDQREANLEIIESKKKLDAVLANPRATEAEREQARITYQRQVLQIDDLRRRGKELAREQRESTRKGVEGSDQVVAARKRISDADERVLTAQRNAAKAAAAVTRTQAEGTQRVIDAQRRVADARHAADVAGQRSAQQVANAQRQVLSAQRNLRQAIEANGVAGTESMRNLTKAMAGLSPAGKRFAVFLFGLRDEARAVRAAVAEQMLPKIQQGILGLLPFLNRFKGFIGGVGSALGDMFKDFVKSLSNPTWTRFFAFIGATAVPTMKLLFQAARNISEGIAEVIMAMSGFNKGFGAGLLGFTEGFAKWARELSTSQGFQKFLAYVRENGPIVINFIKQTAELIQDLVLAAAPIGTIVLRMFTGLFDAINSISIPVLTGIVAGFTLLAGTLVAFRIATIIGKGLHSIVSSFRAIGIWTHNAVVGMTNWLGLTSRSIIPTKAAAGSTAHLAGAIEGLTAMVGRLGQALGVTTAATTAQSGANFRLTEGSAAAAAAMYAQANANVRYSESTVALLGAQNAQAAATTRAAAASAANATAIGAATRAALANFKPTDALGRVAGEAAGPTGKLGDAAKGAGGKLGGLAKAGTGLLGFLGGPWVVGITAAIGVVALLVNDFVQRRKKFNEQVEKVRSGMEALAGAVRDVKAAGRDSAGAIDNALRTMVEKDPALQQLIIDLDKIGLSFKMINDVVEAQGGAGLEQIVNGLKLQKQGLEESIRDFEQSGRRVRTQEEKDQRARLAQLEIVIGALDKEKKKILDNAEADRKRTDALKLLDEQHKLNNDHELAWLNNYGTSSLETRKKLGDEYLRNAQKLDELNAKMVEMQQEEDHGAAAAGRLRTFLDTAYGATQRLDQASANMKTTMVSLKDGLTQAKDAGDKQWKSLDAGTTSGDRNRNALIAAATAIRDNTLASIESGVPMRQAITKNNEQTRALERSAEKLGLNTTQVHRLVLKYGEIPPKVITDLTIQDFKETMEQIQNLQFRQFALRHAADPKQAADMYNRASKGFRLAKPELFHARGGYIDGPGTKTSDSIPARLSRGEFVEQAAAVDYYGRDLMHALNQRRIPRETIPGFAKGGQVWPFRISLAKMKMMSWAEAVAAENRARPGFAVDYDALAPRIPTGGIGSQGLMRVLRRRFPGIPLYSGFRPGEMLAGGLSWHSRYGAKGEPGRAVDIPPRSDIFNWIASNYKAGTKELIWLGNPARNIRNGNWFRYDNALLQQHGTAGMPNAHIHWAYDGGGWLPPGANQMLYNGTRRPEAVLTNGQWTDMRRLANAASEAIGGGRNYHFQFRDTTLTPGYLRSMQARDDAVARAGRAH